MRRLMLDLGRIHIAGLGHPFKSRIFLLIASIFAIAANPEVFLSIIKRITIDMVDTKAGLRIHDVSMKVQLAVSGRILGHVKPPASLLSIPLQKTIGSQSLEVFIVDDRKEILGYRHSYTHGNRVISIWT